MWIENIYPFPNLNGATVEVWEMINYFIPLIFNGCHYLTMLGLQLIHVSKGGPWVEMVFEATASHEKASIFINSFYFDCDWIVHLYIAITTNFQLDRRPTHIVYCDIRLPKTSLRDEASREIPIFVCSSLIAIPRHIQEFAALLPWVMWRPVETGLARSSAWIFSISVATVYSFLYI